MLVNIPLLQEKTLRVATVARQLGISPRTVRYYCEIGELRAFKLAGCWCILESAIARLIAARMNVPPEETRQ